MISKIIDAGITWTPQYSGAQKIIGILEESGGSKPTTIQHEFDITPTKWVHKLSGDRERDVVYDIESGLIVKRTKGVEVIHYSYKNDFLVEIKYENQEDGLIRESLIWENGILVRVEIFDKVRMIETREITCLPEKNIMAGVPKEVMMVMCDNIGYLYFFTHHNFKTFEKVQMIGDKRTVFSHYNFQYIINDNGFIIKRLGSRGAKGQTDIQVLYTPA